MPPTRPHRRHYSRPSVHVVPAVADFDDPNLDEDAVALEDDSPYPEVRSAVANTDDPDMPVNTFRAWFIGVLWALIIPGMNQFFFFRYPSVTVGGVRFFVLTADCGRDHSSRSAQIVAQLLSFPLGRLWARVLPNVKIFGVALNPGPFTVKEHVIITIMATVGYSSAYAVSVQCS